MLLSWWEVVDFPAFYGRDYYNQFDLFAQCLCPCLVDKVSLNICQRLRYKTSRRMPIVLWTFTYCTAKIIDL